MKSLFALGNLTLETFWVEFPVKKYKQFRPFLEVRKNFKLLEYQHIIYHFEARDLEIPNI